MLRFVAESELGHLHAGEQEGLYLCLPLLLTDDLAVREASGKGSGPSDVRWVRPNGLNALYDTSRTWR